MFDFKQKFVVFDFETEGLNLKYSRPWEISYVIGQGTKVLKEEQIYVDVPSLNLSSKVKKLTGFNQEKYDRTKIPAAVAWKKIWPLFSDPDNLLVGQNIINFDLFMIGILAEMAEEEIDYSVLDRFVDTRWLYLAYKNKIEKPRHGSLIEWQMRLSNNRDLKGRSSQLTMLKEFGIEFDKDKLHDGLYDCQKSWEIFCQLKKVLEL